MDFEKDLFKRQKISKITVRVITLLSLNILEDTPIYITNNNIVQIKKKHPEDFAKYGNDLLEIINEPTYISLHPINKSIEYIKVYKKEKDYVLVAVRVSYSGSYYVRTLFVMSNDKVYRYWLAGAFKAY